MYIYICNICISLSLYLSLSIYIYIYAYIARGHHEARRWHPARRGERPSYFITKLLNIKYAVIV